MEVNLRFRYTEDEWIKGSRLLMLADKRSLYSVPIIMVVIFFFSLMVDAFTGIFVPFWVLIFINLVLGAAAIHQLFTEAPRRMFRNDRRTREEIRVTFSEEGVALQSSVGESKLAWSAYETVYENKQVYVIAMSKDLRMMTVVPKRAFSDANQEFEFRRLLGSHIDANFPVKTIEGRTPAEQQYIPASSGPPDWR